MPEAGARLDKLHATYLAARTGNLDVGIDAHCIDRVLPRSEWDGPEPIDLDLLIEGRASDPATATVLVLDCGGTLCAISTGHPLVVRELAATRLFELPSVLWPGLPSAAFLRLAREPDAPPLLILNHRGVSRGSESGPPA
jgi:hypothetical protein